MAHSSVKHIQCVTGNTGRPGLLLLVILTACCWLSGCGYQLRGQAPQSDLPKFQIRGDEPYGEMGNAIRQLIPYSIVDDKDAKSPDLLTLYLLRENTEKRQVSTGKTALFSEYLVTIEATVKVMRAGEDLVEPIQVSASRLFQDDSSQPTGKDLELKLLKSELRTNLARQLIYRLESIPWKKLEAAEKAKASKENATTDQEKPSSTDTQGVEPDHAASP